MFAILVDFQKGNKKYAQQTAVLVQCLDAAYTGGARYALLGLYTDRERDRVRLKMGNALPFLSPETRVKCISIENTAI